jgi:uncharacterized membrane protein
MPNLLLAIANFLHLLATIMWIGGMIIGRLVITPALAGLPEDVRRTVSRAFGQRATAYTNGAIVVFLITGLAMLSQNANFAGVLVFDSAWTQLVLVKHAAVAALILSSVYVNTTVNRHLQTDDVAERARWAERRKDLSDVNLLLGLIILGLTALATAVPPA